ncbi:glycosyltransferase family 4 protein [Crenothrix sp.]|uniref:glycosyltransferase family 4 protein n=1 Tax=Crenothrix sp. TaxID=3100433 RepID=UPI00374DC61C
MKILLAHNYYGSAAPSGENQVFDAERELLHSRGHELVEFTRHSDTLRAQGAIGKLIGGALTPWNTQSYRAIATLVKEFQPDVVHVHNTFPMLSPAIFHAIGNRARRVLTLHNYRLFCPAAIPMRDGKVCTDCLDRHSVWPAIKHGCYRNSRVATLPLAASVALHRGLDTWTGKVDAFVALTEFQRERMVDGGLPAHKVFVKPNFYPGNPPVIAWAKRLPTVVFAGRLTAEKGVASLVKAWALWGTNAPELRIIGDGELRGHLENLAQGLPIRFLGQLTSEQAQHDIAQCSLLILPSECFEGFPMVVREAFAFGTPAAVSNLGPLPSIVKHGLTGVNFEPGNPESLYQTVKATWQNPELLEQLAHNARKAFEANYTEESNYTLLMTIYNPPQVKTKDKIER